MLLKAKNIKYQEFELEDDSEEVYSEFDNDEYIDADEDEEIVQGQIVVFSGNDTFFVESEDELQSYEPEDESEEYLNEHGYEYDEDQGVYLGKTIVIGVSSIEEIENEVVEEDLYEEEDDFDSFVEEIEEPKKHRSEGEMLVDDFSNAIHSLEESLERDLPSWTGSNIEIDTTGEASSVLQGYKKSKDFEIEQSEFITSDEVDNLLGEGATLLSQAKDFNSMNRVFQDLENAIKNITEERLEFYKRDIYAERSVALSEVEEHVQSVISKQRVIIENEAEEHIEKTVDFYKQKMNEDEKLISAGKSIIARREQILDEAYSRSLEMIDESKEQSQRILDDANSTVAESEKIKTGARDEGKRIEDDYRMQGEQIIEEANGESARIIENAEEQHQQIVEAATQDGFNVGYQEGREEAIRENAQLLMDTTTALNDLHKAFPSAVRENEGKLIKICTMLSDALVKEELFNRPEICIKILDRAIKRVSDLERVLIKVNPLDLDLILPKEAYFRGILPDVQDFVITGHYAIPRGGCLIETNSGTIDAQFSAQLGIVNELFNKIRNEYDDADEEAVEEAEA
ncbi:MAG: FliH/SctL family protein [Cyanobacteriota bacterium]